MPTVYDTPNGAERKTYTYWNNNYKINLLYKNNYFEYVII